METGVNDIVERLRSESVVRGHGDYGPSETSLEAANEIEKLRAALEIFLGHPDFHVWVGGNPTRVYEMLASAASLLPKRNLS